MKKKYLLALPILLLSLTSCGLIGGSSGDKPSSGNNDNNDNNNPTVIDNPDIEDDIKTDDSIYDVDAYKNINLEAPDFSTPKILTKDSATYSDLFNLGNKVTISIEVDDSELEKLQEDYSTGYKSEIYRHCKSVTISILNYGNTFTWNFNDVGIRQKGNTSRKSIFEDGNIVNLNHFKLSFDETFDDVEAYGADAYDWTNKAQEKKEREDREFLGLSGLDIKWNKNFDSTHIKEVYASKLYSACGVLSQEIGLCEFNVSSSNHDYKFGLCTLYEPASKSMIKRHLKDDDILNLPEWKEEKAGSYGVSESNYGDFYKASWGVGSGGIWNVGYGDGPDLSNNTVKGSCVGVGNLSGSYIPAYERKTNTDVDYNDSQLFNLANVITNKNYNEIEKVMDLSYFAVTQAVNYYIGNPDDFRNNNNNYMIYFSRVNGKAYYIPIDNDRCFGITKDYDPDGNGLKNAKVFSTTNANSRKVNTLFTKTILASDTNASKAIYLNYVKAIKASDWVKNDTFKALYNIAKATYEASVTSTFTTIDFDLDDQNNLSFNEYMTSKLNQVDLSYDLKPAVVDDGGDDNNDLDDGHNYTPVHIVGEFSGWGSTDHPLEYKGNGIYQVTITISSNTKFKFNRNGEWDQIDWGNDKEKGPNALSLQGGNNFEITGITGTTTLLITVDVINLTCTWEVV